MNFLHCASFSLVDFVAGSQRVPNLSRTNIVAVPTARYQFTNIEVMALDAPVT